MRFEEKKLLISQWRKRRNTFEVEKMFAEFVESGIKVAEVKDWEDMGCTFDSVYSLLHNVAKHYFKGQIRVARREKHLYIAREDL